MAFTALSASADDGVLSDQGGNTWRLTKSGAGLSAALIGEYVTLLAPPTAGNQGHFLITGGGTDYIEYTNVSGAAETVNYWEVVASSLPNDFRMFEQYQVNHTGSIAENRATHSGLSDPLTDAVYGTYCRRMHLARNSNSGDNNGCKTYELSENSPIYQSNNAMAVEAVFRIDKNSTEEVYGGVFVRSGDYTYVLHASHLYVRLLLMRARHDELYKFFYFSGKANRGLRHAWSSLTGLGFSADMQDKWFALRLIVKSMSSDVQMEAYASPDPDSITGGEIDNYVKVFDVLNRNGTDVPLDLDSYGSPTIYDFDTAGSYSSNRIPGVSFSNDTIYANTDYVYWDNFKAWAMP